MKINELIKRISIDDLSYEQLLWLKFAKQLGLNELLLGNIIINKHTHEKYIIDGLNWKYILNTEGILNKFDNELIVHISPVVDCIKQPINSSISLASFHNVGTITHTIDSYRNEINDICNDLREEFCTKRENSVVSLCPNNYISIKKLFNDFFPEDTTLSFPTIAKKQSFKIILN